MTKLLVSVRNAAEAHAALAGGADVIDAKEPANGPLGRCDDENLAGILAAVAKARPVSAAWGELAEGVRPLVAGVAFAKVGLAGCCEEHDWQSRWKRMQNDWPTGCRSVAVAYADAQTAASPDLETVFEAALGAEAGAILIDTFSKNGGNLFDWLPWAGLVAFVRQCRAVRLPIALAGSLGPGEIEQLLPWEPDWIAVRGAACVGGRGGCIQEEKVRALANLVRGKKM